MAYHFKDAGARLPGSSGEAVFSVGATTRRRMNAEPEAELETELDDILQAGLGDIECLPTLDSSDDEEH